MLKEQFFGSQEVAESRFKEAKKLAEATVKQRNEADPDLNEVVECEIDIPGKRYSLTRPDVEEGFVTVIFAWR